MVGSRLKGHTKYRKNNTGNRKAMNRNWSNQKTEEKVELNKFDINKARNDISDLQKQNQTLKDTVTDMQAKSVMNNLIIGDLDEVEEGMAEDVEHTVRSFMLDDLKIPRERIVEIKFERIQRTGLRALNRSRKVLAVFSDTKDKTYVKTFRKHLENTDKFMPDQYPPRL